MPPVNGNKILIKRSDVPSNVPDLTALDLGELGINTHDGKIFIKTETPSLTSIREFLNSDDLPYIYNESLSGVIPKDGGNTITEVFSDVLGGFNNDISGGGSTVVNGEDNDIESDHSIIGSGLNNKIKIGADYSFIAAGQNNRIDHSNVFTLGSNLSSHANDFTYVNNISAQGFFYGDGSNLTGIVASGVVGPDTVVRSLTSNWESTYITVSSLSAAWASSSGDYLPLSGGTLTGTIIGDLSATGSYYGDGSKLTGIVAGDTIATTLVRTNSTFWESTYNTVQTYSASNWDNSSVTSYVNDTFLPIAGGTLTGNLSVLGDLVYVDTSVAVVSAMYIDTNTIVDPALRITQRGNGDVIRVEDSDNPDSTPFIINSDGLVGVGTSSPNEELTVIGNVSATGFYYGDGSNLTGIVAGDSVATNLVRSNSANWDSSYTTLQSASASWQTTFQASSAYVSSNPTGITGASALTKLIQITQAGYNSISPASDTLYIIVG